MGWPTCSSEVSLAWPHETGWIIMAQEAGFLMRVKFRIADYAEPGSQPANDLLLEVPG
jgi:hypothetical protein